MAAALPRRAPRTVGRSRRRLGEHPAVLVARRGVQPDPNANFYLHRPACPGAWSGRVRRRASGGFGAHRTARRSIRTFIVAHPARGSLSSKMQQD